MRTFIKVICIVLISCSGFSQTTLPSFFSDHMVLQQKEHVRIWGKDLPNTEVTVKGSWGISSAVKTSDSGKWNLTLKTPKAGGPYQLIISGSSTLELSDVMIGEVWICSGQSNMFMKMKGYNNQPINGSQEAILNSKNNHIRYFDTERKASLTPMDDVNGKWATANPEETQNFSATAYFFAAKIESLLDVPIGIIHTSWGSSTAEAWMNESSLSEFPQLTAPDEIPERMVMQPPTLLYNAMLHPFIGYTIKGALWYQGESNRLRAKEYQKLLPAMISFWRTQWQQGDFPFYFVQIAPFGYGNGNSAFLREAQMMTMKNTVNTGMAVTMDIGECNFIHPKEKRLVGERLAYWALAKNYGVKGIAFSGPVYKEMKKTDDGKIAIAFDNVTNGLSSFSNELTGFEIAGDDQQFYPARAAIKGNKTVTVWSDKVLNPVAVRYAFYNCIRGTLFNTEGLPASSFRTDQWEE